METKPYKFPVNRNLGTISVGDLAIPVTFWLDGADGCLAFAKMDAGLIPGTGDEIIIDKLYKVIRRRLVYEGDYIDSDKSCRFPCWELTIKPVEWF